jgi:hypothetical protein
MTELPPDAYPERIVTFIDLLGFARDVKMLSERPGLYLSIDALLRRIANCKRDLDSARATKGANYDARMTYFSDCLVMSYRRAANASLRALEDAAFIGQMSLRAGYLVRGAMVVGNLVHDDAVLWGGAQVDAYDLESKSVDTPRVFIAPQVLDLVRTDLERHGSADMLGTFVRDLGTGPFVHILGPDWAFLQREAEKEASGEYGGSGVREMYEEMRAALPVRYQTAPHPRARAKIEWMRDYINGVIDEYGLSPALKIDLPRPPQVLPPPSWISARIGAIKNWLGF